MKKTNKKTSQKKKTTLSPWLWLLLIIPIAIVSYLMIKNKTARGTDLRPELPVSESNPVETQDPRLLPDEITVEEAHKLYLEGTMILDVREVSEWNEGHIPGATLIPLGDLAMESGSVPHLERVILVCRSGNRSAQARDLLKSIGFKFVTSMAGGMNEWVSAGYEVEKSDQK